MILLQLLLVDILSILLVVQLVLIQLLLIRWLLLLIRGLSWKQRSIPKVCKFLTPDSEAELSLRNLHAGRLLCKGCSISQRVELGHLRIIAQLSVSYHIIMIA